MMRVVLDTNSIISGMLWSGSPRLVMDTAQSGNVLLLTSEALVDELRDVLARPKFKPRLQRLNRTDHQIVEAFLHIATVVEPKPIPNIITSDPADNAVLACAIGGQAAYSVTGVTRIYLCWPTIETFP